jgi:DNA-binding response OmpR family regulator
VKNGEILLIVDMDKKYARASKDVLEQLCANDIVIVETLAKAKQEVDKENVLFIIINFLYNNDESINFIKQIRKNTDSKNYKMPIVAFIENNTEIQPQHVLNAGATKCIVKPFNSHDLKEYILDTVKNPKNFIITDGYIGPDRRLQKKSVKNEKRKIR